MAKNPEIDTYIEKAAPFAQPMLNRIRSAVHKASPEIEETIKWSVPHFDYKGPLLGMAAFKEHMSWGFWKAKAMQDPHGLGLDVRVKASSLADLPSEKILVEYIRQAMALNEDGVKVLRAPKQKKADIEMPDDFAKALKKVPAAKRAFDAFPPSHKREYLEWIVDAKREETRQKRLAQAVEWIAEGRSRNWKYQK